MIRDFLRTKRALIADRDELRELLALKDEEVNLAWDQASDRVRKAETERDTWRRDAHREWHLRIAAETTLATVVAELRALREDIRREEQPAFGMARYADAELADFIARDAAHKRLDDGAEDR